MTAIQKANNNIVYMDRHNSKNKDKEHVVKNVVLDLSEVISTGYKDTMSLGIDIKYETYVEIFHVVLNGLVKSRFLFAWDVLNIQHNDIVMSTLCNYVYTYMGSVVDKNNLEDKLEDMVTSIMNVLNKYRYNVSIPRGHVSSYNKLRRITTTLVMLCK